MEMYSMHSKMSEFYNEHVRLDKETRNDLAGFRKTNIERLKIGLTNLDYSHPVEIINQGSYPMFTTVKAENNDYDIDVAVIFNESDLPASAYDAKKLIEAAMIEGGGNFSKPPEARTNAVTVWYQEGHHVDLAIHRVTRTLGSELYEHAGTDWVERDPRSITEWFLGKVMEKSPSKESRATVQPNQMRRIVQFLKFFSKSRSSWKLPGGLLLSVLVEENYISDGNNDDISFVLSLRNIHTRLVSSLSVRNPVDPSQLLTYKSEYINQVRNLRDQLETSLEWLRPLDDSECDQLDAAKVWAKFFNHGFWDEIVIDEANKKQDSIETARKSGNLFASTSGRVTTTSSAEEKPVKIPDHRFYGKEIL